MFAYYTKWILQFSDEVCPLVYPHAKSFPLDDDAMRAFEQMKKELENAALHTVDELLSFTDECDASDAAISATLNQRGRPVAFMFTTFSGSENHYPPVEKEATAIIEVVGKWSYFLSFYSCYRPAINQIHVRQKGKDKNQEQ